MCKRIISVALFVLFLFSVSFASLSADSIWFPSRVTNGSFEEWRPHKPVGWKKSGTVECYQAEPFLGNHAVHLANAQPWSGYLYQEIT